MKEGMSVAVRTAAPQIRMTISSGERMSPRPVSSEIRMPRTLSLGEFKPSMGTTPQVSETSRIRKGTLFKDAPFVVPGLQSLPAKNEKAPSPKRGDAIRPRDIFIPPVRLAPETRVKMYEHAKTKAFEPVAKSVTQERKMSEVAVKAKTDAVHVSTPLRISEQIVPQREIIKPSFEKPIQQAKTEEIISPPAETSLIRRKPEELSEKEKLRLLKRKGVAETKAILAQTGQDLTVDIIRSALMGSEKQTNTQPQVQPETKQLVTQVEKQVTKIVAEKSVSEPEEEKYIFTYDKRAAADRETMIASAVVKLVVDPFNQSKDFQVSGADLADTLPPVPEKGISRLAKLLRIRDGSWKVVSEKIKAISPTSVFGLMIRAYDSLRAAPPIDVQSKSKAEKQAAGRDVDIVLDGASQADLMRR